jgi:hypothetical protein
LRDLVARFRRYLKVLAIASFLGLALGYATFYSVFPNVTVPATGEASLALILGVLSMAAILAGLVTEELPMSVIQAFLSIPLGIFVAFVLAISPTVAAGSVEVRPDEIFPFVLRLGLPMYLIAVPLNSVFGVIGLLIRERFGLRSASFFRASSGGERK